MAPKPAPAKVFKPVPVSKQTVNLSPADSAAPAPAPAPVKVAANLALSEYDKQYADATTDAQKQAVVAAQATEAKRIADANDAWHKANGTGIYATPGGGGSGSSSTTAAGTSNDDRESASAWIRNYLTQFGMSDLSGSVDSLVQQWGTNTQVISNKLKETDSYKSRFKGLIALQAQGVTDVKNEGEYVALETQYRQVFRDAGLQTFLGTAGSRPEQDSIANLVSGFSVSVNEVQSRISDAQRVANDTAPEVKDALQRFYGVSAAQLVQYVLDPVKTTEQINRQVNAGLTSGYAARQSLNLDQATAEQIANIAGTTDMNLAGLQGQLANAGDLARSTQRLASVENSSLTDSEIAQSTFDLDPNATKKVNDLQSRERARFGGSGSVTTGSLSRQRGV